MAKRGRPRKPVKDRIESKTLDYDKITQLARLGMTDVELAAFLEITDRQFRNWKAEDEQLISALKKGRDESDAVVAKALFHRAKGYTHDAVKIMQHNGKPVIVPYKKHYPPDTGAAAFWLKNRRPDKWRDRPAKEDPDDSQVAELLAKLNAMVQDSPEEYSGPEDDEDE